MRYAEMGWRGRGFMLLYISESGDKCVWNVIEYIVKLYHKKKKRKENIGKL
jgi:hypothetical protein